MINIHSNYRDKNDDRSIKWLNESNDGLKIAQFKSQITSRVKVCGSAFL